MTLRHRGSRQVNVRRDAGHIAAVSANGADLKNSNLGMTASTIIAAIMDRLLGDRAAGWMAMSVLQPRL